MFQTHVSNTCFTLFVGLSTRWLRWLPFADFVSGFLRHPTRSASFALTTEPNWFSTRTVLSCAKFSTRDDLDFKQLLALSLVVEVKIDTAVPAVHLCSFWLRSCLLPFAVVPFLAPWDDRFARWIHAAIPPTTRDDSNKTGSTGSATSSS